MDKTEKVENQPVSVNVNIDPVRTPVLYTDNVFIGSNEDGVVLDFGQRVGSSNQMQVVARVGMSREQGKKLVDALSKNLLVNQAKSQTGPKIIN